MKKYIAEFVGALPNAQSIMHIDRTANLAIQGVIRELKEKLAEASDEHLEDIEVDGVVPEQIEYTQFEHDASAVLYGSTDLRPHITVRSLPQGL